MMRAIVDAADLSAFLMHDAGDALFEAVEFLESHNGSESDPHDHRPDLTEALEKINGVRETLDGLPDLLSKLCKLETDLAAAVARADDAEKELGELQDVIAVIRDRGVIHELGCKVYLGASCQCLPRDVADLICP